MDSDLRIELVPTESSSSSSNISSTSYTDSKPHKYYSSKDYEIRPDQISKLIEYKYSGTSEIKNKDKEIENRIGEYFDSIKYKTLPSMTKTQKELFEKFAAIVASKAIQSELPITKFEVSTFKDPEDDRDQTVLRIFTDAIPQQAIAFWGSLENITSEWLGELTKHQKNSFIKNLSLRIHWNESK